MVVQSGMWSICRVELGAMRGPETFVPDELMEGQLVVGFEIIKLVFSGHEPVHVVVTRQVSEVLLLEVVQPASQLVLFLLVLEPDLLFLS